MPLPARECWWRLLDASVRNVDWVRLVTDVKLGGRWADFFFDYQNPGYGGHVDRIDLTDVVDEMGLDFVSWIVNDESVL